MVGDAPPRRPATQPGHGLALARPGAAHVRNKLATSKNLTAHWALSCVGLGCRNCRTVLLRSFHFHVVDCAFPLDRGLACRSSSADLGRLLKPDYVWARPRVQSGESPPRRVDLRRAVLCHLARGDVRELLPKRRRDATPAGCSLPRHLPLSLAAAVCVSQRLTYWS